MRFLIVASLVLSSSLCLAEDFPKNTNEIESLTADQAAELVAKSEGFLALGLTSIDKDVAKELAKYDSESPLVDNSVHIRELQLGDSTEIDKKTLEILKANSKIWLPKKYRD